MKDSFIFTRETAQAIILLKKEERYDAMDYALHYGFGDVTESNNPNYAEITRAIDKANKDKPKGKRSASPPARHKHGQYQNVLLSDKEYETLMAEFPRDYEQRIERLSEYIACKGNKYKNHLAVIRSWARKDQPTQCGSFDTDQFFEAAIARTYGGAAE